MSDDAPTLSHRLNARIPAAETPRPETLVSLATGVVIIAALILARDVLIPITLAIFLSFFLAPLVRLLQRARLPKAAAVIVAVILALGIISMIGMLIGSQITTLVGNLPQYQATVTHKIEAVRNTVTGLAKGVASKLVTDQAQPPANPESLTSPKPGQPPVPVVVQSSSASYFETGKQILEPILSPLGTLAIVFVVTIFILTQQEDLRDRLIRLFGSNDLHRTTQAIDDATQRLTRYFLTQATINASFGLLIGVGLYFIGLPSPVLWGVLAALLRFVPYVGSIISAAFPVALAAAVDPGWSSALWTAGLFLVAESITGQILEPLLYGRSTGLSPTAVVIVAIFWSWIWGPIGLILSTPLTLCLVVLGRHVRHFEFFDVLLGDRPALTLVETFYQRLLAGDPDEISEQAETLLKSRALSSYYDDIAFKALQLLAGDLSRGVIQPAQLDKICEDMEGLVQDLEPHDDVDPEPADAEKAASAEVAGLARADLETSSQPTPEGRASDDQELPAVGRTERSVLCIAGRGPLDAVVASMLAQLLRKHGLGAHPIYQHEVSRSAIARLNTAGVAMVCLVYTDITGNPPHMRYLLRRVRLRLRECPILIGFWQADDSFLSDTAAQGMLGSAFFASSLRDAVNLCLTEAHKSAQMSATLEPETLLS